VKKNSKLKYKPNKENKNRPPIKPQDINLHPSHFYTTRSTKIRVFLPVQTINKNLLKNPQITINFINKPKMIPTAQIQFLIHVELRFKLGLNL